MALDVHVLGTASARPTPERAVSGSLVKGPNGIVVVDCGEGFQSRYALQRRRLKRFSVGAALKPRSVDALVFTHGHLDHTWGALPWLQSMDLENRQQPLLVLGPTSAEAVEALLNDEPLPEETPPADLARQWKAWYALGGDMIRFPVRWVLGDVKADRWIEVDPASGKARLLEEMPQPEGWKNSSLRPVQTEHTVPSCGWMVQQDAMAGKFDRARADEMQLTTKQRALVARGENITDANGETMAASWFRGGKRAAVSVLISGDTATAPEAWQETLAPTLLIHEATFLEEQNDKAEEHMHSTAAGAVASAQAVGATYLALTHYSNRIKTSKKPEDEAKAAADGVAVVALNDNDRLVVDDDGELTHLVWGPEGWATTNIPPNR
jgi:ribonuclease Z